MIRVNQNSQLIQQGGVGSTAQTGAVGSDPALAYRISNALRYMNVGDTFTGKIAGMNGQQIELLLADKSTVGAKLSQQMALKVGQTMSFEVTGNAAGKVQLTPLYANLDGSSAIEKALDAAELPLDARTSEMVQSMMEEGMSIDSKSLQDMMRLVNANPDAAPSTIVQMKHFDIPINESNTEQYELYRSNSHQIASEAGHLAEGFAELAKESPSMNREILGIFTGDVPEEVRAQLKNALDGGEYAPVRSVEQSVIQNTEQNPEAVQTADDPEAAKTLPGQPALGEGGAVPAEAPEAGEASRSRGSEALYGEHTVTEDLGKLLDENGRQNLAGRMEDLGIPSSVTEQVRSGKLNTAETLDILKASFEELSKTAPDKEKYASSLKGLMGSDEYGKLLKNEIAGKLLMKPQDVVSREKVQEYFERMLRDTARAGELLNATGHGDTTLAKGVQNLNRNVDFMNQINQAFTYIQLPLKMNDMAQHGDLYVYTNKKKLAEKDGNVSALLHLEMKTLGTMDIHVRMNPEGNVKTNFILQKEEMLDFIADHLPELDERLKKRGYSMSSNVSLNREAKTVPEIMFDQGRNMRMIQHTSFEAKA